MHDWDAKAEWMRRMGATAATWTDSVLTSLALGPQPGTEPTTQPMTREESEARMLAERQRVAGLAASGYRRVSGETK
jgi:hypothetical protein